MRIVSRTTLLVSMLALVCTFPFQGAFAQDAAVSSSPLSEADTNRIIQAFTNKESDFRKALLQYAFKRDAVIQIIGDGGLGEQVTGEYHRTSAFTFDDSGTRFEKILFFPLPSYAGITQEDLEDLGGINPFALESAKAGQYNFKYVGKERIDDLDLFVFDISPKVMPEAKKTKERLFLGRVWVDDRDLQIVKSKGKGVPETKENKFPVVETYREQIDGKYWFPTYSYADDRLIFDDGQVLHLRVRIKFTDYQRASGKLRVIDMEGEVPASKAKPSPSPKRKPEDE